MSKQALIQFVEDQIVVKDFPKFNGKTGTFTIRKISNNVGVERCFPIASPMIENIELNKQGSVRKSRIYYLRGLRGKKAKIKELKK